MFFNKKKQGKSKAIIVVKTKMGIIFQGEMIDIPLAEDIIIQKSIHFFDDPAPCHIHRSAVRVRLLAELEEDLEKQVWDRWQEYLGIEDIELIDILNQD